MITEDDYIPPTILSQDLFCVRALVNYLLRQQKKVNLSNRISLLIDNGEKKRSFEQTIKLCDTATSFVNFCDL